MRIILIGAEGQLGGDLGRECRNRGHALHAWGRGRLDIADPVAVHRKIVPLRPDCVINAAAYNDVAGAERHPEDALRTNALGVRWIAQACNAAGATLLHYSTDYVFGGDKRGAYAETDSPRPLSAYGVSKHAGEQFARAAVRRHYILRVAGVYGPHGRHTRRGNFVESVLRKSGEGRRLRVVGDQFATPAFGPAIASRSFELLDRHAPYGLYHLGGGEAVSWHEFATRICASARRAADIVRAELDEYSREVRRPRNSALSNAKIESAGIERMPGIDSCLRKYLSLRKRG